MKDVQKGFRLAVYNALNGNLNWGGNGVPVKDEKHEGTEDLFVILSTQTGTQVDDNDSTWITRATIVLDIIDQTFSLVSKDAVDDVAGQIGLIIFPTRSTIGITAPAGFQYTNGTVDSDRHLDFEVSETETVIRRIVTYQFDIVQT